VDEHVLTICKFRLVRNDEPVSLSAIEPFYSPTDPDRRFVVVIKTVTGHGPLSSDWPELRTETLRI
jgi:hypothetical protein